MGGEGFGAFYGNDEGFEVATVEFEVDRLIGVLGNVEEAGEMVNRAEMQGL